MIATLARLGRGRGREVGVLPLIAAAQGAAALLGLVASGLEITWIVGHLTATEEAGLDVSAPVPPAWRPIYADRLTTLGLYAARLDGTQAVRLRTTLAEVTHRLDTAPLGEVEGTIAYLEHAYLGADRVLFRYLLAATPLGLISGSLGLGLDLLPTSTTASTTTSTTGSTTASTTASTTPSTTPSSPWPWLALAAAIALAYHLTTRSAHRG